jgi:hypothetical protein
MKTYWSINGINRTARGQSCYAFAKLDGSNLRFEWSKKRGWWKFGTRRRLFDENDHEYGEAIATFLEKYGDGVPKALKDNKEYRGVDRCIVFCEFFGENSFAGWHFEEPHDVVMIDVAPHKKGIIAPKQFVKHFGHLDIPEVVYMGNFNNEFIQAVREGKYPVDEGVVAKGINPGKKAPHGLWMIKVKTLDWLDRLKRKAENSPELRKILAENLREQTE